ncbi:MAG TPA: hypothetical protein VMD56_00180 [Steroidobacteraceae bacterium]|nr:hypothetical protein [Steroidobacteraceae bacterium]
MEAARLERRHGRSLSAIALCVACAAQGSAWGAAPGASARTAHTTNTGTALPSPDSPPTAADLQSAQLCRKDVNFMAYSTLEPGGQRVQESVTWDDRSNSYVVRGPILGAMLNDPGVSTIPSDAAAPQTLFRIAIRADYSNPIERFCEYNFQEMADCDAHGDITYTQIFTDCDLQTLRHVVMITPDQAGSVQLIDIRFQDVTGAFGNPLDLSEGTDLRLRMR